MEGKANKVVVSIALDKETLEAGVALRETVDPDRMNLLSPEEARWVSGLLMHTARVVEHNNGVAARMLADGLPRAQVLEEMQARYAADLALFARETSDQAEH